MIKKHNNYILKNEKYYKDREKIEIHWHKLALRFVYLWWKQWKNYHKICFL